MDYYTRRLQQTPFEKLHPEEQREVRHLFNRIKRIDDHLVNGSVRSENLLKQNPKWTFPKAKPQFGTTEFPIASSGITRGDVEAPAFAARGPRGVRVLNTGYTVMAMKRPTVTIEATSHTCERKNCGRTLYGQRRICVDHQPGIRVKTRSVKISKSFGSIREPRPRIQDESVRVEAPLKGVLASNPSMRPRLVRKAA